MISEEQIELLTERLINRIQKANVYFLKNIGATIKKIKSLKPTEAQQLIQILKYGTSYDDIVRQIRKYTNLNIEDIDNIFSSYAKKDQQFYKQFYKYRNIPFVPYEQNAALQAQTMALANIVKNELYDFTRANVLGYTITDETGKVLFKGLKETYNELLDTALVNVGTGKETFDNAMRRILKDIGESGLKTINYQSGRSIRLDSAVRTHLLSGLRELHNENQRIIGEEFDADGYEISVHANPAIDHEKAQGRQFSLKEYDKLNAGLAAKDYTGKIITLDHDGKNGYRPISELNCYHYVFSIVLGVNKPEYSEKQLQEIINNNNKGFDFDGKHYSLYEGQQLQRRIERKIREQKDVQILAKESGNGLLVGESQQKITQLTQKYKELNDVSGLKPRKERMTVAGYKRTSIAKIKELQGFKDFEIYEMNDPKFGKVGKKYFDMPTNDSLDKYVIQSGNMWERMQNNAVYQKEMYGVARDIEELKRPSPIDVVVYSGVDNNFDPTKSDFVISTSVSKGTASLYRTLSGGKEKAKIIKIHIEKGANIISTFNTKAKRFNSQGELIIPISEIKNIEKVYDNNYILRKNK